MCLLVRGKPKAFHVSYLDTKPASHVRRNNILHRHHLNKSGKIIKQLQAEYAFYRCYKSNKSHTLHQKLLCSCNGQIGSSTLGLHSKTCDKDHTQTDHDPCPGCRVVWRGMQNVASLPGSLLPRTLKTSISLVPLAFAIFLFEV